MEMRKAGAEKCGLTIVVTGAVFAVFIITRLWRLMDIPFGLHTDETSMAYSAWCLSQYGVDRHLNSMPVYLLNFGGGQVHCILIYWQPCSRYLISTWR